MVSPIAMYGCESWTIKKVEHQRTDAFELWCCRRLLRVSWTARRSNQSIIKEISPECSLERLMLRLKLQYFGHLMRRVDSLKSAIIIHISPPSHPSHPILFLLLFLLPWHIQVLKNLCAKMKKRGDV